MKVAHGARSISFSNPTRCMTGCSPRNDWMLTAYQNSHRSARKIEPFIRKHNIDMLEFEPVQYRSYADFFERRFRSGVRRFPSDHDTMGAFAEARFACSGGSAVSGQKSLPECGPPTWTPGSTTPPIWA